VSQPPELPGSRRLKRAAASAGSSAYQGVFEAVGSILIACVAGYWIDRKFETAPVGLLVGAAIGFGAFVLRLVRLGKELHPDGEKGRAATGTSAESLGSEFGDDGAIGESPGLSDALREDPEQTPDRDEKDSSDRFDRGGRVE
jgi:F0F1-type ATP synthase assembly protein I